MSRCQHGREPDEWCLPCQLARVECASVVPDGPLPLVPGPFALSGEPGPDLEVEVERLVGLLALPALTLAALRAHDFDLESLGTAHCWMPPAEFIAREGEWRAELATAVARERARCRAVVWRHFADEFKGNAALAEIDGGGV